MRITEPRTDDTPDPTRPLSAPTGPHYGHIDAASGGADSSPFETMSSDERAEFLRSHRPGEQPSDADSGARH